MVLGLLLLLEPPVQVVGQAFILVREQPVFAPVGPMLVKLERQ